MARFMTTDWAQQVREVFNAWPDPDRKASKLQDFWDWIAMIAPFVTGRLALTATGLPAGGEGDTLGLEFDSGTIAGAFVQERGTAEPDAVFLLAAKLDHADLAGDAGRPITTSRKMVMYRKLMLEKGDTLQFFTAAFFWTELLAAIQSVPAEVLAQ